MDVIIGIDPHKASHTAVAIGDGEVELGRLQVRSGRSQVDRLLAWAEPFAQRTWAIEGADGLGFLLAQQLVAAGEAVVDVPATLAARTRLLGTGRSNKNDPNDALSVAIDGVAAPRPARGAAGRAQRAVAAAGEAQHRHRRTSAPGSCPGSTRCWSELAPGGIAKEINASDADRVPRRRHPDRRRSSSSLRPGRRARSTTSAASTPRLKASAQTDPRRRGRVGHHASPTSSGSDRSSPRCSSATPATSPGSPTATATPPTTAPHPSSSPPAAASCTGSPQRGNRTLNHALHMAAICQLRQPHTDGRAYFDRKVAEGKTNKEALRALKRQISNAVYRHLVADARR